MVDEIKQQPKKISQFRRFVGGVNRRVLQSQRPQLQRYGAPAISQRTSQAVGRGIGLPIRRQGYQGRKGYMGRGRPRGSFRYQINGRPVDVFTYRKYASRMRALQRQQMSQQMIPKVNPYAQYQQGQPQFPQQQFPPQQNQQPFNQQMSQMNIDNPSKFPQPNDGEGMVGTKIIEPEYNPYPKEMHTWHSFNPLGLDKGSIAAPEQYFYEINLFNGEKVLRKKGELV